MTFLYALLISLIFHSFLFIKLSATNPTSKMNYSDKIGISEIKTRLLFKEENKKKTFSQDKNKTIQKNSPTVSAQKNSPPLNSDKTRAKKTEGQNSLLASYLSEIRKLIVENKYKSHIARKLHLKGVVEVGFTITRPHQVNDLKVITSSTIAPLDDSALQTVRNIDSFPDVPTELKSDSLEITFKVVYE